MLSTMREKFGPIFIGIIVAFIAFVFIFAGVFSPDPSYTGGAAGSVDGEIISITEFNQALNRRMAFFKNLNMNPDQLKNFKIRQSVFNELVNNKLLVQHGKKLGLSPSEKEVRKVIREIPAFQKEGQFDLKQYEQILSANRYTPASFEKRIREDLISQRWSRHLKEMIQVSKSEVEKEYVVNNTKRSIKYVLVSKEMGRKGVKVSNKDLNEYLKNEDKLNYVKVQFESQKDTKYKGKTFEKEKYEIVRNAILADRTEEVQKVITKIADQVVSDMGVKKADDKKLNRYLKAYGGKVQSSDAISARNRYLPGMGEVPDVVMDAFAKRSPIDARSGGKPKKYAVAKGTLVALVVDSEEADLSKLTENERSRLLGQIASTKQRSLEESILKGIREQADKKGAVKMNAQVVDGES